MSDLCPPLIPSGIERVGARTRYRRLVPDVNGEKLAFSLSLFLSLFLFLSFSLFFVVRTMLGLSWFSPSDNRLSITGGLTALKCVPSVTVRQFLQYISRIAYFFRDLVTFVASCFNSNDVLDLKAKRKAIFYYGSKENSMTIEWIQMLEPVATRSFLPFISSIYFRFILNQCFYSFENSNFPLCQYCESYNNKLHEIG